MVPFPGLYRMEQIEIIPESQRIQAFREGERKLGIQWV
jgi:hypothetical protein